jgi:sialate O-acetylesterase
MFHPLFTNHMVLQRAAPIPVFGRVEPQASVIITLGEHTVTTEADALGDWQVTLPAMHAATELRLRLEKDSGPGATLHEVAIGDVWVCSGQSNMEMPLRDCDTAPQDIAAAYHPDLRLRVIPTHVATLPIQTVGGDGWLECSPDSAAKFSALAYHAGRSLVEAERVPIGLIQAAVGATPAESWVDRAVLDADDDYRPILERFETCVRACEANMDAARRQYEAAFTQWDHDADLAEREGRPIPGAFPKLTPPGHPWTPAGLWNGMIAPLTLLPIRGVLWYQGAAAPERAMQYRKLFRALIRQWRRAWRQPDMPFVFGQEAAFGPRRDQPGEHSWAEIREAQQMALAEPHTAMAVAIDLGEATDIHPKRKKPLGERYAACARAVAYGRDIPHAGPVFDHMVSQDDGSIRLRFRETRGGLRTSDNRPPIGFAVSPGCTDFSKGNRNFAWAEAQIDGDDVIVWSGSVANPMAVRYAWAQNPACNLTDATGLPASPFRTDDWPGVTVGNG